MSNNEDEDEQEPDLSSNLKFIDGEPTLFRNWGYELTPKTVGESTFTLIDYTDYTEKFEERDSDKYFVTIEVWESAEYKIIEEPDSTEIISEKKNMEKLIDINQFLVLRNDELTKELKMLTKNYEILTKETKDEIVSLKNRIKELIESKVSVSRTPSYWVEEVFSEEFERENVEE